VWIEADDVEAVEEAVDRELQRIIENEGRSAASVCVATVRARTRDHLRRTLELVRWEDREDGDVLCETVRRLKGLEFDTVILAADKDIKPEEEALLYVGVSRAVSELIVIGPRDFADRLGLVHD